MKNFKRDLILIIDIEATCWDDEEYQTEHSSLLEIGVVKFCLKTNTIIDSASYLIKQKESLSDFCVSLTGITDKEVNESGLEFTKISKLIRKRFGSKNVSFAGWGSDNNFLDSFVKSNQGYINPFSSSYLDLSLLFSYYIRDSKKYSVTSALEFLNLKFEGKPHRALTDAENTARIFSKIKITQ